jgi:resuscitation-promoting factor RpfB
VPGPFEVWNSVLRFLTGRTGRLAAQAGVLAAVIGGTVAYAAMDKTVTLTVDGRSHEVRAFARTVGGLLDSQDITVGARDIVAPGRAAALHDGDRVVVRFARQLRVSLDGTQRTYWTTELTVDDALAALGIRAEGARLSASRSQPIGRDGFALSVSTPKTVKLNAAGASRTVVSTAPTVGLLLVEQGLIMRPLDRLSVPVTAPVTQGLSIALTRIDRRRVTARESVPFTVTRKSSSSMFRGDTKVISDGSAGSRVAVYDVVLANGKVASRRLISAKVTRAPVVEVLMVGTKARPSTGGSVGGGLDSLNWAALADCESGGNPRAVNPAGYYGLYQFSLGTWHSVGGSGNPIDNSSSEQTYRAKLLYKRSGAGQWPVCGQKLFS